MPAKKNPQAAAGAASGGGDSKEKKGGASVKVTISTQPRNHFPVSI